MDRNSVDTLTDKSTERKIRIAAEKIFMEKGYADTRTRDIADEGGVNPALVNYYFRSKERLFKIIMEEKLSLFFDFIFEILKNSSLTIGERIRLVVDKYTEMLTEFPDFPIFILSELRKNPHFFVNKLDVKESFNESMSEFLKNTHFQSKEEVVQIIMNMLGMTLFPFLVKDIIISLFDFSEKEYYSVLDKRKNLIPVWMDEILKIQPQ